MSLPAIEVSALSKRYIIQHESRHDNLRDTLHHAARKAWRRMRWGTGFESEEFWALRDVAFSIDPGEVVGVIGRNGAGKSTLLKVLSRITEPTSGSITLRGRVASLLEVGTGFHPELSGRENIFLNGAILGMSRVEIRKKFDEIVAFAEVERFLDTPVKRYSSGMYVRLAFAVAAHLDPEILIVDEVLAVGDAAFQDKCLGKMQSLVRGGGRTIIFVSHNIGAIARLCNRCIMLQGGQVVIDAAPEQAINAYLSVGLTTSAETGISLDHVAKEAGSPVRIQSMLINDGTPQKNRQPLRASLVVESSEPVEKVGFGIGFCNAEGRRLVTLDSDYDGTFLKLPHAGRHLVTVELPQFDLLPGRYRIDVGAFGGSHQNLFYAGDCAIVEVHPGASTPTHVLTAQGDWRPASRWSVA